MGMFCLEQLTAFVKAKSAHRCYCGEGRLLSTVYSASRNRPRPEGAAQLHSKGQPMI